MPKIKSVERPERGRAAPFETHPQKGEMERKQRRDGDKSKEQRIPGCAQLGGQKKTHRRPYACWSRCSDGNSTGKKDRSPSRVVQDPPCAPLCLAEVDILGRSNVSWWFTGKNKQTLLLRRWNDSLERSLAWHHGVNLLGFIFSVYPQTFGLSALGDFAKVAAGVADSIA